MLRRIIDLSLVTRSFPNPEPYKAPPQYAHHEQIGEAYNRSELMGYLDLKGFYLGDDGEPYTEVTCTVDPLGTHGETLWLDDRVMFGRLSPEKKWLVRDVTQISISQLVGDAAIIDMSHIEPGQAIDVADLQKYGAHVRDRDIVFIRTDYGLKMKDAREKHSQEFYSKSPGLTVAAAKWLAEEKKIKVLAMDTRSPEVQTQVWKDISEIAYPVHRVMHDHGVVLIEDVANLDAISAERVFAFCGLPLKTELISGGPAMVLAVEEGKSGHKVVNLSNRLYPFPGEVPVEPFERIEPFSQIESVLKRMRITKFTLSGLGYGYPGGMLDWGELVTFNDRLGTHLEMPGLAQSKRLSPIDLDPGDLYGTAAVIDLTNVGPERVVTACDLKKRGAHVQEGDIVILRTDFIDWHYNLPGFCHLSPSLSADSTEWLIDKKVRMVISDMVSLDRVAPDSGAQRLNRRALWDHGILIVNMASNLWLIKKPRVKIAVLPLPIVGIISSPARVVAVEEYT
ncbi:MAG: hypothetical protein HPY71_15470 [Firmicutes bacterium]|nr:hypothetical protein [Bacillota bacterium]